MKNNGTLSLNKKPTTAKVLIASQTIGEGHITIGEILCKTLSKQPSLEVEHRVFGGGVSNGFYKRAVRRFPLWFSLTWWIEELPVFDVFEFLLNIRFLKQMLDILRTENPDFVITTRFSLSQVFSFARHLLSSRVKILNVIPDAGPPRRSNYPYLKIFRPDILIVFDKKTAQLTKKKFSLSPDQIILSGFASGFAPNTNEDLRPETEPGQKPAKFSLPFESENNPSGPDNKTVLVAGGSQAIARLMPLLKKLAVFDCTNGKRWRILVLCGRDKKTFHSLQKRRQRSDSFQNIFPIPWISRAQIFETMKTSDLAILGSVAPATFFELLDAECLPILVYRALHHEKHNVEFLLENRIGFYLPDKHRLIGEIGHFLNIPESDKKNLKKRGRKIREENSERLNRLGDMIESLRRQMD